MKTLDLYAGAGGLSLGAHLAGLETVAAVESNVHAAKTFELNFPNARVYPKEVGQSLYELESYSGKVNFLIGGPPCQGFSHSNRQTRNLDNKKNWEYVNLLKAVKVVRPQWVVIENVEGFKTLHKGQVVNNIHSKLEKQGYKVRFSNLLNAVEFGVPQVRSRYFIIASVHTGEALEIVGSKQEVITVEQALSGLPEGLSVGNAPDALPYQKRRQKLSTYAMKMMEDSTESKDNFTTRNQDYVVDRYAHVPQGGNHEDIPDCLMENYKDRSKTHSGIYRRLHPQRPACVISNFRKNMLIHPQENRGLSIREAARLQSFPDRFEFIGPSEQRQIQIGNAVPPLLAKAVFTSILNS